MNKKAAIFACVVMILVPLASAPAMAAASSPMQIAPSDPGTGQGDTNTTTNTSGDGGQTFSPPSNNSSNTTRLNVTATGNATNGGGGILNFNVTKFTNGVFSAASTWILKHMQWALGPIVGYINEEIASFPVPGTPTDPSTWIDFFHDGIDSDGLWSGTWSGFWLFWFLGGVALTYGWQSYAELDPEEKINEVRTLKMATYNWVASPLVAPLVYHLINAVSQMLMPEGYQLFASWEAVLSLGPGLILLALIIATGNFIVLGYGVGVLLAIGLGGHVAFALYPSAWGAFAISNKYIRMYSGFPLGLIGGLGFIKIAQSTLMRLMFLYPMDESPLLGIAVITIGLFIMWYELPKMVLGSIVELTATSAALQSSKKKIGQAEQWADRHSSQKVREKGKEYGHRAKQTFQPDRVRNRLAPNRGPSREEAQTNHFQKTVADQSVQSRSAHRSPTVGREEYYQQRKSRLKRERDYHQNN